jgi:hypothetical protein
MNMNRLTSSLTAIVVLGVTVVGCDDPPVTPVDNTIPVPATYTFASRFDATKTSVSYDGQVVRSLLIQDLTSAVNNLAKPGAVAVTEADLLALYEHSDAANLMTKVTVVGKELLETQYNRIATGKKLSDKISSATVIGMNTTADALIRSWIHSAAVNAQDASKLGTSAVLIDENGMDLGEMINKTLLGAVAYYQGTTVYLSGIASKDNATAVSDGNGGTLAYTEMEHNWDEAFGYFGAARDYATQYTDDKLTGTSADYSYDSNGDGKIDLRSEYNYTVARYAARRDKASPGTDFTKEIFDAFLKGRTAITNKGTTAEINANRSAVSAAWEKIMASSFVHYLNGVKAEMAEVGEPDFNENGMRHEWSEMKGFAIALQFNATKMISDAQLAQIHSLIGASPVVAVPGTQENSTYVASLDAAKALIKSIYGFSDAQLAAW